MRASQVCLLGLASAAAFAAGALAGPPRSTADMPASRAAVQAPLAGAEPVRSFADVQRDLGEVLQVAISSADERGAVYHQLDDFVASYRRGMTGGDLPLMSRTELIEVKVGETLHRAQLGESQIETVLALVDEWIDAAAHIEVTP